MSNNNPFDYINFAIYGKGIDKPANESYNQWLMNKALSFHPDLIMVAQGLNRKWPENVMTPEIHWEMTKYIVNKVKRPWKWYKSRQEPTEDKNKIDTIKIYYNCSHSEAEIIAQMIDDKEWKRIDKEVHPSPNIDDEI